MTGGVKSWTKDAKARPKVTVLDTDLRLPQDEALAMLELGVAKRVIIGGKYYPDAVVYLAKRA